MTFHTLETTYTVVNPATLELLGRHLSETEVLRLVLTTDPSLELVWFPTPTFDNRHIAAEHWADCLTIAQSLADFSAFSPDERTAMKLDYNHTARLANFHTRRAERGAHVH